MKIARSSPTNPFLPHPHPVDGGRLEPALVKTGDPSARQYSPSAKTEGLDEPPLPENVPIPCPRGCGDPSPSRVLADAGTHPRPRGCGDPSPSENPPPQRRKRESIPPPLSSRMRGPISSPTSKSDAPSGRPIPHPLSSRMREPTPSRVLAYAGTHPHPPTESLLSR